MVIGYWLIESIHPDSYQDQIPQKVCKQKLKIWYNLVFWSFGGIIYLLIFTDFNYLYLCVTFTAYPESKRRAFI